MAAHTDQSDRGRERILDGGEEPRLVDEPCPAVSAAESSVDARRQRLLQRIEPSLGDLIELRERPDHHRRIARSAPESSGPI